MFSMMACATSNRSKGSRWCSREANYFGRVAKLDWQNDEPVVQDGMLDEVRVFLRDRQFSRPKFDGNLPIARGTDELCVRRIVDVRAGGNT